MNKLKAKVVENGMSMDELSRAVGISRDTLYRRLSSGAGSFRVAEAKKISEVLHLTSEERVPALALSDHHVHRQGGEQGEQGDKEVHQGAPRLVRPKTHS